jgi:flagellar hook protein FlgE
MDALAVAASGVRSAEVRLAASAHDVANLTTPSFRPLRADQTALAEGGSVVHVSQEPAPREVDLARELVEQMLAALQLKGSLRVLATASELRGQLVDLVG